MAIPVQLSRAKPKAMVPVVPRSSGSDDDGEEEVGMSVRANVDSEDDMHVDTSSVDESDHKKLVEEDSGSEIGMDTDNSEGVLVESSDTDIGGSEGAELSPADHVTADAAPWDDASSSGATGGGVKKVKIAGLYKPPTHDELQTLKETQNLFKSNLMRLQVCVCVCAQCIMIIYVALPHIAISFKCFLYCVEYNIIIVPLNTSLYYCATFFVA